MLKFSFILAVYDISTVIASQGYKICYHIQVIFCDFYRKIRWYMGLMGRMMMRCYGCQWIKIKGRMATRAEAPILIVAPHSSFFDAIAVYWSNVPCLVNRIENLQLPLFGSRCLICCILSHIGNVSLHSVQVLSYINVSFCRLSHLLRA